MSRLVAAVIVLALAGCGATRGKLIEYRDRVERKEAAERIVERTITKPEVSYVAVEKLIALPEELTNPCGITYLANKKVGEYVRVADTNTAYLEDCRKRMEEINRRQAAARGK